MERKLKERVVGAVLLVLAAVLVIPLFLDGPDPGSDETRSSVALPPAEETDARTRTVRLEQSRDTPTAPPIRTEVAAEEAQAAAAAEPSSSRPPAGVGQPDTATDSQPQQPTAAVPSEPEPEPEPEPERSEPEPATSPPAQRAMPAASSSPDPAESASWVVQLGSFGSRDNAERLAEELRGKRYQSFVTRVETDGRTLHRVRVGPGGAREEADRLLDRLRSDGYSGQAVPE